MEDIQKGDFKMKKIDLKFKPEALLTVGTLALGVAQLVLGNKKEATERSKMKEEILKELAEKVTKQN